MGRKRGRRRKKRGAIASAFWPFDKNASHFNNRRTHNPIQTLTQHHHSKTYREQFRRAEKDVSLGIADAAGQAFGITP